MNTFIFELPKIQKIFDLFLPLRPIVAGFDSWTCNLSKVVDSFLIFQAQKCKFYIRDIKYFLIKLSSTKIVPENSFLVTVHPSSLFTNIDHEEGAEACFKKLEERKNKSITSIVIKSLILIILKWNAFQFANEYYRQTTGEMALIFAMLFMDNFELFSWKRIKRGNKASGKNCYKIECEKTKTQKQNYSVHGIQNLALSHLFWKITFI